MPIGLPQSPGVLWVHIALSICALITDGTHPPGSRVPSYRHLALAQGVSLAPVRQAYDYLQGVGVLKGVARQGVWVTRLPQVEDLPQVGSVSGEVARLRLEVAGLRAEVAALRELVALGPVRLAREA